MSEWKQKDRALAELSTLGFVRTLENRNPGDIVRMLSGLYIVSTNGGLKRVTEADAAEIEATQARAQK